MICFLTVVFVVSMLLDFGFHLRSWRIDEKGFPLWMEMMVCAWFRFLGYTLSAYDYFCWVFVIVERYCVFCVFLDLLNQSIHSVPRRCTDERWIITDGWLRFQKRKSAGYYLDSSWFICFGLFLTLYIVSLFDLLFIVPCISSFKLQHGCLIKDEFGASSIWWIQVSL